MTFPTATSKNIDGKTLTVPTDFTAPVNIVFLAYTENQQYDVNRWIDFIETLPDGLAIRVYEVPLLKKMSKPMQWMVNYWMDQGIRDPEKRATTITLYTDVPAFLRPLGIPDTSVIDTLLVSPQGEVFWQTRGAITLEKSTELHQQLVSALELEQA